MLDMYEALYPGAQLAIEVDWSSGHSKHRTDALNVLSMGVNFGGKQTIPHSSKMVDGCLATTTPAAPATAAPTTAAPATAAQTIRPTTSTLQLGDLQHFYFRSAAERQADGATDGLPDRPPFYKPLSMPPDEYVGLAKGKKQVLYERGLWKDGMVEKVDEEDPKGRDQSMSMDHTLGSCRDFRTEQTALQAMVEARGHILVMSPKGHCELAGQGVEYDWGRQKQYFRRHNKCKTGEGFHTLILEAMSPVALPLSTSRKFARKARAYRRAYREGVDNEHAIIEETIKKYRTHRNAVDFAGKFIRDA